ncbi:MAG: hypothetical protein ABL974_21875 [Prosthecobacter sp.]
MKYNLTNNQKELARFLVGLAKDKKQGETFYLSASDNGFYIRNTLGGVCPPPNPGAWTSGDLDVLEKAGLLVLERERRDQFPRIKFTLCGLAYEAVETNFAEERKLQQPLSTLAHSCPPEIAIPLDKLQREFPDMLKLGFLIMRFDTTRPHERIVTTIKETGKKLGLDIVRADENEFHADLWGNVRTYLHGCSFGIAVYERISTDQPNANVGLEVGYLMAMGKPVLLLKDQTLEDLPSDLAGKLYKPFDAHDPEGSIPKGMAKWLEQNGIVGRDASALV